MFRSFRGASFRGAERHAGTIAWLTAHIVIAVCPAFIVAELALRAQQALGPYYDLNLADIDLSEISETVNHRPSPFKAYNGVRWDEHGVRIYTESALVSALEQTFDRKKLLFLGDSFVRGFSDDRDTLPWQVWKHLEADRLAVTPYNAGMTSYSPALFIPQARELMPLIRPDFVVVVIDHTDLGDDFLRYRHLVVWDARGHITGVRSTPIAVEHAQGLMRARESSLFLVRFFRRLYHLHVYMPKRQAEYRRQHDSGHPLDLVRDVDANAAKAHVEEIRFFERNLSELADLLTDALGDRRRILFVCHPHLFHLKPDGQGRYLNSLVFDSVGKVAREKGVRFYNATTDLRRAFGDTPEIYYQLGDEYSHFNPAGMRIYGEVLAREIATLWRALPDG